MNTPSTQPTHPSLLPQLLRRATLATALLAGAGTLSGCDEASAAPTGDAADDDATEARLAALEAREEIRATIAGFAQVVDAADLDSLADLAPTLADDFVLDVIDFDGGEYHFEGASGLVDGFGPIMVDAQANLALSEVAVAVDGDLATAHFTFINSVKPPPQLGLDVGVKVLLLADNTATFAREGDAWRLSSLELVHSLAYPGAIPGL
jgi:ketosteroid isomerase-like protein